MKKRCEIEEKYKWDLSSYCTSMEDCARELKECSLRFSSVAEFENKLNTKENIFACLTLESEINKILEKLYVYSSLKLKEDAKNSMAVELNEKVGAVCVEYNAISSFVSVEISELDNDFLTELIEKGLKEYK